MASPIPGKKRVPKAPVQPKQPTGPKLEVDSFLSGPKLSVDPVQKQRLQANRDDRILRQMPITQKDLGRIKKYYGIK